MTLSARYLCVTAVVLGLVAIFLAPLTSAQSHALNGQIEGLVLDQAGAAVANAQIKITNKETGTVRSTKSDEGGVYRFPLLPLGTWRIEAELSGFKRFVQDGIILSAGQTVTLDLVLVPGGVAETVTVSEDVPIADTGKTDLGRVMNSREVHSIPLPTRNPFNFAILQANVTGHPNRGNLYPQLNVNGFLRRTYWQVDGNTNSRGEIAGQRTMHISETFVSEMQLLTPGFAAEFGNTTGMIVNMITQSGTNDLHGSAMYLFARPSFYARPFFFADARLPDSFINNVAVTLSGPVLKDRWHFYLGHERFNRVDNISRNRQVTISEGNKRELIEAGLPASIFRASIPGAEDASYYIFRTDLQLNRNNRLSTRLNHSDVILRNGGGGLNTWERSLDTKVPDHSVGIQLASFAQSGLNELRFHFVRSRVSNVRNENSSTAIAVNIADVANFGSPGSGTDAISNQTQLQNNFTWMRGPHAVKVGGGFIAIGAFNRESTSAMYAFPSISAWRRARSGADLHAYTLYNETFGDPETRLNSTYWNLFVQDDWKATRRLKFNYGLRYDLYVVPRADLAAPHPLSRSFNLDKNNWAPRLGVVYSLREGGRPLVLRAGAGIYYEPPWTGMYTKALRNNASLRFFNLQFLGSHDGERQPDRFAPKFPQIFSGTQPPGSPVPPQQLVTIDPDFENMYAIHSNIQLEQALTNDLSFTVGYVHSGGRHVPVYRSVNAFDPVRYLADGRPVFGPARLDPRFNVIQSVESVGVSQYDALTMQVMQRFSRGIQFSAHYTLSRAVDDAPEQEVTYDDGARNQRALSDPTSRSRDKGYSYGDQRHTFVMSFVGRPIVESRNRLFRFLLNDNQFGIIARASSGERFSVRSARDLNNDGLSWPDRPVGIKRNSSKAPPQFNLDLRYSRFIDFTERYKLEVFGEFQNLFNINNIYSYTELTVPVDTATGEMTGPMPDFRTRGPKSLESRQVQIGVKFIF